MMQPTGGNMGAPPQMAAAPPQYQHQQPPQYQHQQPPQPWMQPPQYQVPQQQQPPPSAYYHQQAPAQPQYSAAPAQPTSPDEIRSLWVGDLPYWVDENYLLSCFSQTGEVISTKVIRNKQTGQSEGYGFLEFVSHAAAEKNLQTFNGTLMPNSDQSFKLNWASVGGGEKRTDNTPEYTIFVGDLAADVTDYTLLETFKVNYASVKSAKVVADRLTGRTKGYGFVKFADESEQLRAMTEMNGRFCSTRPMRIGPAANKRNTSDQTQVSYQNGQGTQNEDDPTNTTVFVGNLDANVTDEHLRQLFGQCGQLLHVKIPVGKRCGFVQFADRSCAEEAIRILNGTQLGGQSIRLSWGRSPSNKQPQVDSNQWNGGYYGYAPGYDAYGYGAATQDPNMYYAGYAGYGNYVPQQQQQTMQQQTTQQPQ